MFFLAIFMPLSRCLIVCIKRSFISLALRLFAVRVKMLILYCLQKFLILLPIKHSA